MGANRSQGRSAERGRGVRSTVVDVQGLKHSVDLARGRLRTEAGQTMPEYAVVLTVITLALIAVFGAFSGVVADAINSIAGAIGGAVG